MMAVDTETQARPIPRVAKELVASSGFLLARLGLAFKTKALARIEDEGFDTHDYGVLAIPTGRFLEAGRTPLRGPRPDEHRVPPGVPAQLLARALRPHVDHQDDPAALRPQGEHDPGHGQAREQRPAPRRPAHRAEAAAARAPGAV